MDVLSLDTGRERRSLAERLAASVGRGRGSLVDGLSGVLSGRRNGEPAGYRAIRAIANRTKTTGFRRSACVRRWLAFIVLEVGSDIILTLPLVFWYKQGVGEGELGRVCRE
jgi:hypothetical protein